MTLCPACGAQPTRAIYLGVPVWLCLDMRCCSVWGFWSWVPALLPIPNWAGEFTFLAYDHTRLSWWGAFWVWWRGPGEED